MLHAHRLRIHEVQVRMNARGFGRSSIDYPRSAYYMVKVLLGAVRRPLSPPPDSDRGGRGERATGRSAGGRGPGDRRQRDRPGRASAGMSTTRFAAGIGIMAARWRWRRHRAATLEVTSAANQPGSLGETISKPARATRSSSRRASTC